MDTRKLLAVTLITLGLLVAFAYGVGVGRHEIFPFGLLRDAKQLIAPPPPPHENFGPSYRRRLSQFRALPNPPDIVMLGDSIIREGEWQELLPDLRIANRGVGGDTSLGLLNRLNDTLDTTPSIVFIMVGLNDLRHNIPAATIAANIENILTTIHASGATPVFQSTLHVGADHDDQLNNNIAQINHAVHRYCQQHHIAYIDLNALFAPRGHLQRQYTIDGVHLTGEAYTVWADHVRSHVEQVRQTSARNDNASR